jgi:hypothetical protein
MRITPLSPMDGDPALGCEEVKTSEGKSQLKELYGREARCVNQHCFPSVTIEQTNEPEKFYRTRTEILPKSNDKTIVIFSSPLLLHLKDF